jgi:DNA-binding NtrC family response regulator
MLRESDGASLAPLVLIVDDDQQELRRLQSELSSSGFQVETSPCGDPALHRLEHEVFDAVVLCTCKPGREGILVLQRARTAQVSAAFLVLTDTAHFEIAVEAMRLGAFDYLEKPVNSEVLALRLKRALNGCSLRREVAQLRADIGIRCGLIGSSSAMNRVFQMIRQVAPTVASVLVTGETGTGKELVARAIHALSSRSSQSFVPVSCSALPEALLESELFGHVKGSFTGAVCTQRGLIENATGGTVFLDEIETLTPAMQAKLLRTVEERTIQRIGARHDIPVDFRLVAASNANLDELVDDGAFRSDLFYRLKVFPIHIPPLRERQDDIPALAELFVARFAERSGARPPTISARTIDRLLAYSWPGNVRELRNTMERAVIVSQGKEELEVNLREAGEQDRGAGLANLAMDHWPLQRVEGEYIRKVLAATNGNRNVAARILGIDRRTLYRKMRALEHDTQA